MSCGRHGICPTRRERGDESDRQADAKDEANALKEKLEASGATVELK